MNIDEILDRIYKMPEQSVECIKEIVSEITYPKGFCLMKANKLEANIYFIKKGIVRAYIDSGDKDITFWFGKEGDTILSMNSYIQNKKGYESIELLEDSTFFEIEVRSLQELFHTDIHIANWGRKLAEQELIKTEERLISRQFRTALERYKDLITENPDLLQRVQLGHIASYLGITQVSLSRVRAKL